MLILDEFLSEQPHCPYLPDRAFHSESLVVGAMEPAEYLGLLDRFYRRSGRILYRPICSWCRQCVPLRVLAQEFVPTRSQARAWRRNADLQVRIAEPRLDARRLELYRQYVRRKHGPAPGEPDEPPGLLEMWGFLIDSPVPTFEFQYWAGERLVGVGIVDDLGSASSSVYFYYDLDEARRSLGVYSMLVELDWARRRGYRHHYLGYWIRDARTMAYKAGYRPAEVLAAEGQWVRLQGEAEGEVKRQKSKGKRRK